MKYLSYKLALNSFRIAQWLAPFRTGNLRYNAMFLIMQPNGFDIMYSDRFAHYIDFLEEGTIRSHKHAGFITITTFWSIVDYLTSMIVSGKSDFFYRDDNLDTEIYDDYMSTSNEARQMQMNRSIERYEVTAL